VPVLPLLVRGIPAPNPSAPPIPLLRGKAHESAITAGIDLASSPRSCATTADSSSAREAMKSGPHIYTRIRDGPSRGIAAKLRVTDVWAGADGTLDMTVACQRLGRRGRESK
jgi:hypothetical protein